MPKTKPAWDLPSKTHLVTGPAVTPISPRKAPTVFLHINMDTDAYNALCDLRDRLNAPHIDPQALTLEEMQLLHSKCKEATPGIARELLEAFFKAKQAGPLKIPGVGALRAPHSIGELVNLCVRFALDNATKLPLPDHTSYTRKEATTYINKK